MMFFQYVQNSQLLFVNNYVVIAYYKPGNMVTTNCLSSLNIRYETSTILMEVALHFNAL